MVKIAKYLLTDGKGVKQRTKQPPLICSNWYLYIPDSSSLVLSVHCVHSSHLLLCLFEQIRASERLTGCIYPIDSLGENSCLAQPQSGS